MSLFEYKVITSGKGGFASPALLEKFLNDLGREEWEIIQFHTQPDNFLVFTGLARRSTQRDWTLQDAAAAAAKAEAEKLRAEFEAKFKAATGSGPAPEERAASFLEEKVAPEDGFRKPIDTSHDADAEEEEAKEEDDWDKLVEEDELPTFFDAIKPHMRRNQRGPGMSVGVDYLAKKWDQSEDDLKGALVECGFKVPEDEDETPEYLEFEGDLYWININRRGELWINTKEKPRPVFRAVKAQKSEIQEPPKPERKHHEPKPKLMPTEAAAAAAEGDTAGLEAATPATEPAPQVPAATAELPSGPELLDKIRPMMRRNRRGPGGSGSASFLSRALKVREADLIAAFKAIGLVVPSTPNEKPTNVEIGNSVWWVNLDSRGNVWINGREKKPGETVEAGDTPAVAAGGEPGSAAPAAGEPGVAAATEATSTPQAEPGAATPATRADLPLESGAFSAAPDAVPAPEVAPAATVEANVPFAPGEMRAESATPVSAASGNTGALAEIRGLLKEGRTGAFAGRIERLAEKAGKSPEELVATLVAAGLNVPEKPREKPVFVEHAGEIFWFNRNAKGELWLNAKASKFADKDDEGEEPAEGEGEGEGGDGGEKKSRRPRTKKKTD